MCSIQNSVALVTGGSSGLGRATVKYFLRKGIKGICSFSRSPFNNHQLETSHSDQLLTFAGSVTNEQDVQNALEAIKQKFGRLDLVINCAGIMVGQPIYDAKTHKSHDFYMFDNIMKINVYGTFNVNRLSIPLMAKNDPVDGIRGLIINVSSIAGADGPKNYMAYAVSKSAVDGMTLPMARDLASLGIRVNAISPGPFKTKLLDGVLTEEEHVNQMVEALVAPKRLGKPQEFAYLIESIYHNHYINGQVIRIDAGLRFSQA